MKKDELEKIAAQVDWEALGAKISEVLKLDVPVKITISILQSASDPSYYIKGESQDLCGFTGIMAQVFASLKVEFVFTYKDLWVGGGIDYRWEYKAYGGNGYLLLKASFNIETREWIVIINE